MDPEGPPVRSNVLTFEPAATERATDNELVEEIVDEDCPLVVDEIVDWAGINVGETKLVSCPNEAGVVVEFMDEFVDDTFSQPQ